MVHANALLLSNAQATTNAGVGTKVLYINRENLAITCTLALQIQEKKRNFASDLSCGGESLTCDGELSENEVVVNGGVWCANHTTAET